MSILPDLQRWLDEAAAEHGVPGASAAVAVGGERAEAATGVVNRETGVATTTDSVFQIGSVTKVLTASLVLQLVDEGLVDLDAPVRDYLPEFGVADRSVTATVTTRQLLSHTAGFAGDLFEDFGRGDDALDRLLAHMRTAATQVHPPGELFSYCNSGFCVLGALTVKFRGGTWESVLRERLLDPMGATHVALFADEAILFRAAAGHQREPERLFPRWQLPRSQASAGATPCAAPRELVRFGRLLLDDGVAANGTRVLPAGILDRLREPQTDVPVRNGRGATRWGLGMMLFDWDGAEVLGHDGGTLGQAALWRIVPDRDVVLAISVNGGAEAGFFDDVLAAIMRETTGIRVPARELPPAEPVPFDPAALTGRYATPLVAYDVVAADDGLDITTIPQGVAAEVGEPAHTARFVALGDGRFVAAEPADGVHPVLAFLDGGRYLYNGRAAPRLG